MFQKGEFIIYGTAGVCQIEEVGCPQEVRGIDLSRQYFTLRPLYQTGLIYAPVDTPVFMRRVLSRAQAEELIEKIPSIHADELSTSRDQKLLTDHYRAVFDSHQCEQLISLIKTVYEKSRICSSNGKKPPQLDQRNLKRAQDLLHGEIAVALDIAPDEVERYISDRVALTAQS